MQLKIDDAVWCEYWILNAFKEHSEQVGGIFRVHSIAENGAGVISTPEGEVLLDSQRSYHVVGKYVKRWFGGRRYVPRAS